MMAITDNGGDGVLLSKPSNDGHELLERTPSAYNPLTTFLLPRGESRHYQQQYADMYFARLAQLKPAAESIASEAFQDLDIGGDSPHHVDRVLDVRQGELCWVIGTIYMEMPLKPNILDDIGKEHWIAAPPQREKFTSEGDVDQIMLEDESGRLRLTGNVLKSFLLVTGCIVAVIGTENADGDFEVLDIRVPDLPRQPQRWERDDGDAAIKGKSTTKMHGEGGKVALMSGLSISGDAGDTLTLDLLMEYLLGESTSPSDQATAATISRLIIAGNALEHASPIPSRDDMAAAAKKSKKTYGYDSAAYNAAPTERLDTWLANLLPSMPITLIPGAHDPTSVQLPQQPIHPAMFPHCRSYIEPPDSKTQSWFDNATNPFEADIDGYRLLGTGGQTVDDVFKYVQGDERLEMMEAMMRWRLTAPTAPDTLWCYPFQDGDAFVMKESPHVYFVGNQPKFETRLIEGPVGQTIRLIAVPKFRETGEIVLLDMETLEPEIVKFQPFEGE